MKCSESTTTGMNHEYESTQNRKKEAVAQVAFCQSNLTKKRFPQKFQAPEQTEETQTWVARDKAFGCSEIRQLGAKGQAAPLNLVVQVVTPVKPKKKRMKDVLYMCRSITQTKKHKSTQVLPVLVFQCDYCRCCYVLICTGARQHATSDSAEPSCHAMLTRRESGGKLPACLDLRFLQKGDGQKSKQIHLPPRKDPRVV